MDILTNENLRELTIKPDGMCISIYMPTIPIGEAQQGSIRLQNLLKDADEKLSGRGLRTPDVRQLLKPAETLVKDKQFWQHQSDGLALFVSSKGIQYYRLPIHFDELVIVHERFHIKPLLPLLLTGDGHFFVLALSQNSVRLLQCTRDNFSEIDLQGMPTSMDEALQFDDPERQLQFHTSSSSPGGAGKRPAIFHGHGVGVDDEKPNILRYFRKVNQGLWELLNTENSPLILAGVEYLQPIYKEVNDYPHLMDEGIEGSPDRWNAKEIHDRAWKIVEPLFGGSQQEAKDRYTQFAESKNGKAFNDLKTIIPAAIGGQVETLFVVTDIQKWGRFDPETNSIQLHEEPETYDEDLLDFAAVQTILNRGTVYSVKAEEMPDTSPIAAIFRY